MAGLSTAAKSAALNAWKTLIDAGSGPGVLKIYTTSFGTLLVSAALADPCGTESGGVLTLTTPITDSSADASGTAATARIEDSAGNIVLTPITVGASGSGLEIILSSTTITAGQPVSITSATIQF